jgi:hypothetical protein
MKTFWKTFGLSIPLAIGIALSMISIVYCVNCYNSLEDDGIIIAVTSLFGFPLLFGSLATLFPKKN